MEKVFNWPWWNVLRGENRDGRRIDSAAQENAERHIGHQPAPGGGLQRRANLLTPFTGLPFLAPCHRGRMVAAAGSDSITNSQYRQVLSSLDPAS